jgi:hypothetical protein
MTGNRAKYAQSPLATVNGGGKIDSAPWVRNPTVPPPPRLATIEQAAIYLGLGSSGQADEQSEAPAQSETPTPTQRKKPKKSGVRSVWRLIDRGDLTPVRLPGLRRTMVQWAELDALVDRSIDGEPA